MKNKYLIESQIACLIKTTRFANCLLSDEQIEHFKKYLIKLLLWNKRINLISKNDENRVVSRHFLESIAIFDVIDFPINSCIIDVGTGAGFPGLPMKIIRPDLNLTLLDSKRFKTLFLTDVLNVLSLSYVEVVKERAEIACLKPALNKKFDFVMARAVTNLSTIYKWTNKFLKPGASILALKGGDIEKEIELFRKEYMTVDVKILPLKSHLVKSDSNIFIVQIINCTI